MSVTEKQIIPASEVDGIHSGEVRQNAMLLRLVVQHRHFGTRHLRDDIHNQKCASMCIQMLSVVCN